MSKNRKKTHNYNPHGDINNRRQVPRTAWSNVRSGVKLNANVKIASAISMFLSNLPTVSALPARQYQEAIYFINSSLTNIASNWTSTNSTTYCEPEREKDIETQCFAYMSTHLENIAQAAADVCWKITTDNDNLHPNGEDMYKCVKDVIDDYFPQLLDKYGFEAQALVDLCKFDFEIVLDGYGMSSGWIDKIQIYTQVAGQNITKELCKKFEDELTKNVKDTCDPPADHSKLILGLTIVGGIVGGCLALAMMAAVSRKGYDKYKEWSANRNSSSNENKKLLN